MAISTAPGKIILSGEYSVVYNAPALGISINRYARVTIASNQTGHVCLELEDLKHQKKCILFSLETIDDATGMLCRNHARN